MSLVEGLAAQEIGCGTEGGGTAFGLPSEARGVVGAGAYCAVMDREGLGGYVVLSDGPGQFQMRVGDGSGGVGSGDDVGLDGGGECTSPQDGGLLGGEDGASHAGLGCIDCAKDGGMGGDDFLDVSGSLIELGGQVADVIEKIMLGLAEGNSRGFLMTEGFLHGAEQAFDAREG